jgi:hypothetical protein
MRGESTSLLYKSAKTKLFCCYAESVIVELHFLSSAAEGEVPTAIFKVVSVVSVRTEVLAE